MLALQKIASEPGLGLTSVQDSDPPGVGEVLIAVAACGICGSDVHIALWHAGYEFVAEHLPLTIGHEFSGYVQEVGPGVEDLSIGDPVVVVPGVVCGRCDACTAAKPDDCTNRRSIGMTLPGGAAELVTVPARQCIRLADGIDIELAALAEPLGIGLSAVRTAQMVGNERVLVMGPGTIGQAIAVMARRAGASAVVVVGQNDPARLKTVRALGFAHALELGGRTLGEALAASGSEGEFDIVFEATGVPETIKAGLSVLRAAGVLVVTGIHPRAAEVDLTALVRRKHQIRGSYRASWQMWTEVLDTLHTDGNRFAPMISHRLPLDQAKRGFELAASRSASKVLLIPDKISARSVRLKNVSIALVAP